MSKQLVPVKKTSTTLAVKSNNPFDYFKVQQSKKEEYAREHPEQLEKLGDILDKQRKFYDSNRDSLQGRLNAKALNVPAMILRTSKGVTKRNEEKKTTFVTYSFLVWFGNLEGVTGEGITHENGFINIPLKDSNKDKTNNNKQEEKEKENEAKKFIKIKSFSKSYLGVVKNNVSDSLEKLVPGELVMLENLTARISRSGDKTYINLNASNIEKKDTYALSSNMYRILSEVYQERIFEKCTIEYDPNNPPEDTPLEWFFVDNNYDYKALSKTKNASIIYHNIIANDSTYWTKEVKGGGSNSPFIGCTLSVIQSRDSIISKNQENILIIAPIYSSSIINCFGISDPLAWSDLGPYIIKEVPFFMVGNLNIAATVGQKYNIKKKIEESIIPEEQEQEDEDEQQRKQQKDMEMDNENDEGDFERFQDHTGLYAFELCYNTYAMFADWAAYLYHFGIKVSSDYLLEEFKGWKMNPNLIRNNNTSKSNFVCLNEMEDPISYIRGLRKNTRSVFRCVISYGFTDEQKKVISEMNEEQGKQLLIMLCSSSIGGKPKKLPNGHPLEGSFFQTNQPPRKYFFCVKLSGTRYDPDLNRFLLGEKKEPKVFDSVNRTVTIQQQSTITAQQQQKPSPDTNKRKSNEFDSNTTVEEYNSEDERQLDDMTSYQPSLDEIEEKDSLKKSRKMRKVNDQGDE